MKEKLINSKGITLIALVITIIVMLILVAVTIRVASNGKLFQHAANATSSTKTAAEGENAILNDDLGIEEIVDNAITPKAQPGVKVTKKTPYKSDGKIAQIPANFVVSNIETEQSIDDGLVIYYQGNAESIDWTNHELARKTYDQFVWIPIQDANRMFICQAKSGTNGDCNIVLGEDGNPICTAHKDENLEKAKKMAGRLYANSTGNSFGSSYSNGIWDENSGIREPAVLSNYIDTSPDLETLQNEYNSITKSVLENKGFWAGRYETSGMNGNTLHVIAGTTTGINNENWYAMYTKQKNYANNLNCYGGMMTGAAYDQMLLFVNGGACPNGNPYYVMNNYYIAHNLSNPYKTGKINYPSSPYNDLVRNIYDLCGNVTERTTEAYLHSYRVIRGGGYGSFAANSASFRNSSKPDVQSTGNGSRAVLFLK